MIGILYRALHRGLVMMLANVCVMLTRFTNYVYMAELISLIPLRLGEQVRFQFYRRTLSACGEDVTVSFGTVLSYPDITVGNHVLLGTYNIIGHADLGDYVLTAQGCHVISTAQGHAFDNTSMPIMHQPGAAGRVRLGPDVWLGANVIILANVGRGCVVGAGSVVTRAVPDWAVAAGNPARVLRYRKEQTGAEG